MVSPQLLMTITFGPICKNCLHRAIMTIQAMLYLPVMAISLSVAMTGIFLQFSNDLNCFAEDTYSSILADNNRRKIKIVWH